MLIWFISLTSIKNLAGWELLRFIFSISEWFHNILGGRIHAPLSLKPTSSVYWFSHTHFSHIDVSQCFHCLIHQSSLALNSEWSRGHFQFSNQVWLTHRCQHQKFLRGSGSEDVPLPGWVAIHQPSQLKNMKSTYNLRCCVWCTCNSHSWEDAQQLQKQLNPSFPVTQWSAFQ